MGCGGLELDQVSTWVRKLIFPCMKMQPISELTMAISLPGHRIRWVSQSAALVIAGF